MFEESAVTVGEGAGVVELTVVKSGVNSRDVLVNFATLDGDAVGNHYTVHLYIHIHVCRMIEVIKYPLWIMGELSCFILCVFPQNDVYGTHMHH